jgi:dTDP-4-dehydrorhamnose reductase
MRVLVTGATGFVGGNVARVFQVLGDQVLCAVRRRPPDGFGHPWRLTDLTDTDDVRRALEEHQAQAVVHLAIRNDLLDLYQDRRGAYGDYVTATRRIADAANSEGATVLYVSTDWVFDGTGHMVAEDEPVSPVNLYGLFKALSEQTVLDRARHGLVARIGGVQGTHLVRPDTPRQQDAGFGYLVLSIVDALGQGRSFEVWESDRINSVATPVLASDAGLLMHRALHAGADGVLHLVGAQPVTRRQLALRTCEVFGLDAGLLRFVPPPAGAVGEAPVPRDTSLGTERTRAVLGAEPPSLLDTLRGLATERRTADVRIAATDAMT